MQLVGEWRARVKRQLSPHQPELLIRLNSGSNRRLAPAPTDIPRDTTKGTQAHWHARDPWMHTREISLSVVGARRLRCEGGNPLILARS